ncbi:MAG: N-acetylmuramoyl-L-alanine amidase [Lysinibacillus sp.]
MTYLIALDDGHGMQTPGKRTPHIASLGRYIPENEFNRAVVKFLDIELKLCGFGTLLVAPTDADTSLESRVALANKAGAHFYLSIHYDALDGKFDGPSKDPEGFTAFVFLNNTNTKSGQFAKLAVKHLSSGTPQKNRGVKEANYYVLRATNMPAALIECGFMDNEREALLMVNVAFQKEVAQELTKAMCEHFKVKYVAAVAEVPTKKEETTVANSLTSTAKSDLKELLKETHKRGILKVDHSDRVDRMTESEVLGLVISIVKRNL